MIKWDVGLLTTVRMAPKTEVTKTTIVVDALIMLWMLLSQSLAPLLINIAPVRAIRLQRKSANF